MQNIHFLNTEELKELSEHIDHPKWRNSYTNSDKKLLNYNFIKLKDSTLNINIDTVKK